MKKRNVSPIACFTVFRKAPDGCGWLWHLTLGDGYGPIVRQGWRVTLRDAKLDAQAAMGSASIAAYVKKLERSLASQAGKEKAS